MKRTDPVHIALAANHRYAPGLKATLVSMVRACSNRGRLRFHVFSDGLTDDDKSDLIALAERFGYREEIDFREPDMTVMERKFSAYYGTHTAFVRIFFPEMLPELDWVLWADVDTLWFRDPIELWNLREDRYPLLWCEDLPSTRRFVRDWHMQFDETFDDRAYCCSGVMLMNLAKLRQEKFVARGLELVSRYGTPPFADQGVFNALCGREAKVVDGSWDLLVPASGVADRFVLHFNGLGKLFGNVAYTGWRPLYEIWFRHYAQVVEGRTGAQVWPLWKRLFVTMLGALSPFSPIVDFLPFRHWQRDNIRRTLFFARLRGRSLWSPSGGYP